MTILRNPHRLNYVCISNKCLEDSRLSFEARGLLAYLLSRPDKWQIKTKHLQDVGNCGRDKILRIFSELEDAGYLRRKTLQDAAGRLAGKEIEISESADFPNGGVSRSSGFTIVGKGDPLISTELEVSTEEEASTDLPEVSGSTKTSRQTDEIWEAMLKACGLEGAKPTQSERGKWNKCCKELKQIGASADEIREHARSYRQRWPNMELSPLALVKNWNQCRASKAVSNGFDWMSI